MQPRILQDIDDLNFDPARGRPAQGRKDKDAPPPAGPGEARRHARVAAASMAHTNRQDPAAGAPGVYRGTVSGRLDHIHDMPQMPRRPLRRHGAGPPLAFGAAPRSWTWVRCRRREIGAVLFDPGHTRALRSRHPRSWRPSKAKNISPERPGTSPVLGGRTPPGTGELRSAKYRVWFYVDGRVG